MNEKFALLFALAAHSAATAEPDKYPDPARSSLHAPLVISVDSVAAVSIGMTKRQVYRLIGTPHFGEGIGVRRWNYLFDLHRGSKSLGSACAYQLQFDHGRVSAVAWQTQNCSDLAD